MKPIKIGTRGSPLALHQARWVEARLKTLHPGLVIEIQIIATSADTMPRAQITALGGKGLFVKEIEEALLAGKIDIAVHSLKDLPTELPKGLSLSAVPLRVDPRDALVSRDHKKFYELPPDSRVATSSLRRSCQLKAARQDIEIVPMRGNVGTRLEKLQRGEVDAIILAVAGLTRLGLQEKITEVLDVDIVVPAIGQGALGLETRDQAAVFDLVRRLDDTPTRAAVTAERALARGLRATCQTPVGGYGQARGMTLTLTGVVAALDGKRVIKDKVTGVLADPKSLGAQLADRLLAAGADEILRELTGC